MRVYINGTEVTSVVTEVLLDRSLEMAGAELRLRAVCAPQDRFLPKLNPGWGDAATVRYEGAALFSGRVQRVRYDAERLTLELVCLEQTALLARNEVYGPLEGAPAQVARTLIAAAGLRSGTLWAKGGTVRLPPTCRRSCLAGIRAAYGGQCFTEERDGAVDVLRPGDRRYTLRGGQLLGLRAENSVEDLVTGAEVRGGTGALLAQTADAGWERQFGRRRTVRALEGAQSGAAGQAQAALRGAVRQAEAVLWGDPEARCGAVVTLDQGLYGAAGSYLIRRVLHRAWDGLFTTTLGLTTEGMT